MANYSCKKNFPYDLTLSHNTSVTDMQTDGRQLRPIARSLLKYLRLKRYDAIAAELRSERSYTSRITALFIHKLINSGHTASNYLLTTDRPLVMTQDDDRLVSAVALINADTMHVCTADRLLLTTASQAAAHTDNVR